MIKINYESDFKLTETTEEQRFADVPFEFVYSTSSGIYTASYDGRKYVNCKPNSAHSVTVIFNNHGLGVGKLKVRREFFIPDGDFSDGVYNAVSNDTTDVILVEGKTEGFDVEETFRPPYVVSEGSLVPNEVVDSLDSYASDKALSANQGRILNERINVVTTDVEEIDASIKNINETLGRTNAAINENTNNITSNAEEIIKTKANLEALEGIVAEKADASKVNQIEIDVQKNTNAISNNTARLVVLEGDGEGSIKKAVAEGIAEVVANAPEDLNTLKEVADYIASDKTKANEIEKAISDLGVKDTQLEDSINANATAILSKQPLLTGDEFKTINGESIMGKGNIEIGGGEGGGIDSEPTNAVIEAIEPSLVSDALRKTAQVLTEEEKEQARKNIGAQKQLQLSVKDNGNIVLSNLNGETKEFMPATPSGDPMHYAYVSAGAEYNDTTSFIIKDTPWKNLVDPIAYKAQWNLDIVADNLVQSDSITYNGVSYRYAKDTRTSPTDGIQPRYRIVVKDDATGKWVWDDSKVLHLPNHWYLNGLGDITNGEMREIYRIEKKDMSSGVYMLYWRQNTLRTATVRQGSYGVQGAGYSVSQNTTIEVVNFDTLATFEHDVFGSVNIRHIISKTNRLTLEYINKTISNGTFSTANLVTCDFRRLKNPISMDNSPNLSRATTIQLISKAIPTTAITITLHADAYARLAEDADIVAALEAKPLVTLVSA